MQTLCTKVACIHDVCKLVVFLTPSPILALGNLFKQFPLLPLLFGEPPVRTSRIYMPLGIHPVCHKPPVCDLFGFVSVGAGRIQTTIATQIGPLPPCTYDTDDDSGSGFVAEIPVNNLYMHARPTMRPLPIVLGKSHNFSGAPRWLNGRGRK